MKTYLPPRLAWRPQRVAPAAVPCTCAQHWGHWSGAGRLPESRAWRPGCGTSYARCRECHRRWWCSGRGGCHWAGTHNTAAPPTGEGRENCEWNDTWIHVNQFSVTWSLTTTCLCLLKSFSVSCSWAVLKGRCFVPTLEDFGSNGKDLIKSVCTMLGVAGKD